MWKTQLKQLLVVLSLVCGATTATAQDARTVIDKAVKAHGGDENLGKFKAVSAKWEGKRKIENMFYWDSINVVSYQMPNKVRIDSEVTNPDGNKFTVYKFVNGNKGWLGARSRGREMKESEVAQLMDEMYATWLASMVPLNDKGFEFSLVGEATVDDKDTVGVRVSRKDRPDVNLYFDKKSGLLLKSERRTKDASTNQEYTAESIYRDHKAFQGVMWATKRIDKRDGMDLESGSGRFELSDFQGHDTLDEKLFAKP